MADTLDKVVFTLEGDTVMAEMTIFVPGLGKRAVCFPFKCSSDLSAALLRNVLAATLQTAMQDTRRSAYHEGYRAGRAKSKRETWFSGRL